MNFTSHSQAGQDSWVYWMLHEPEPDKPHTFLDVGCGDPVFISNSFALEQLGWTGLGVDADAQWIKPWEDKRTNPFMVADVTSVNWTLCLPRLVWDYLSLDVDHAQVAALKNLLAHKIRFRVATVEHDFYRFKGPPAPRDEIRRLLTAFGYTMLCEDVCCAGPPYEDWWIDTKRVNPSVASRFSCVNTEGAEIWKRGEIK